MSDVPRSRGRPKGTGIDDQALLARIAAILAREATTKPTTAIRMVGVSDPSVVRRLREKLKDQAIVDIAAPPVAVVAAHAPRAEKTEPSPIFVPATDPRTIETVASPATAKPALAATATTPDTSPAPPPVTPGRPPPAVIDPMTHWMHIGIAAAANGLQLQARILEQMLEWPAARSAIRQQALLAETMIEAVAEQQRRLAKKGQP